MPYMDHLGDHDKLFWDGFKLIAPESCLTGQLGAVPFQAFHIQQRINQRETVQTLGR